MFKCVCIYCDKKLSYTIYDNRINIFISKYNNVINVCSFKRVCGNSVENCIILHLKYTVKPYAYFVVQCKGTHGENRRVRSLRHAHFTQSRMAFRCRSLSIMDLFNNEKLTSMT